MRFSVVINTYNRAASIRNTLESLRRQTYTDFEVVVVNGPSTDNTEAVLAEYEGRVRVYRCPITNLSVSRNIGVRASAGDVVAFIDDDSVATPRWLEELAAAYQDPEVGGAGGIVYDPSGVTLQSRFAAVHRDGRLEPCVEPPLEKYITAFADPGLYLQGTNMSFRRTVLQEIGGFDESFLYNFDDVDVCLQVLDKGHKLKPLEGAAVQHKFLTSHNRTDRKVIVDPFNLTCCFIHFVLSHARFGYTSRQRLHRVWEETNALRQRAEQNVSKGSLTPEQRDYHHLRLDEALEAGLGTGLKTSRRGVAVEDADASAFVPYPTIRPAQSRLKLCFLSRSYPPEQAEGTGRYSHELAVGFARLGHEVHVVTQSSDMHRVDLEDGVWVHRILASDRRVPELDGLAIASHIAYIVSVYQEVCRIHEEGPIDLVSAPLWGVDGLVCGFDPRFPTTTTLITAMKALTSMAQWATNDAYCRHVVALEEQLVGRSHYLHAVSQPILDRAVQDYKADPAKAFVANLGLRDRAASYPRRRSDGKLRILFVSRLETRKGVGLFLEAAAQLCREFPNAEFFLAGKDIALEGENHRQRFLAQYANDPFVLARVAFTGFLTEEELYQHYADADVVCVPSLYESFGLIFVEGMMFGKPVIGSRAGGMVDVIADGEQGYLIPPGDTAVLIESLRKLMSNPDLRARFGQRSRELYEQRFTMPVMAANCEAAFRKVIAKHRLTGSSPAVPFARATVSQQLADVLAKGLGVSPEHAKVAADRLFDLQQPTDQPASKTEDLPVPIVVPASQLEDRPVGLLARVRQRLSRMRHVGLALRYARRILFMPVFIFRSYLALNELSTVADQSFERLRAMVDSLRGMVEGQRVEVERLADRAATFQAILKAMDSAIKEQAAQPTETRTPTRAQKEPRVRLYHELARTARDDGAAQTAVAE